MWISFLVRQRRSEIDSGVRMMVWRTGKHFTDWFLSTKHVSGCLKLGEGF